MSGHSKWSTIKRKKGAADAKRGKIFGRIVKEISIAIKEGGGTDPSANPRLRLAIANAKGVNMPKDNIERVINKAEAGEENYSEVSYEGYAPGGIAIFVEATTDNLNRTVASVRAIFTKRGGNLATSGSVDYLFERKGVFVVAAENVALSQEDFEMELIDGGLETLEKEEEEYLIYTSFEDFGSMQKKLDELNIEPKNAELQRMPLSTNSVDAETAKKVLALIDKLEEDDDVNQVFHNMEITDEILADLAAN